MSESRAVAVFGSSQTEPESQDWMDAENVGRQLAGSNLAVITGGYSGTMEAVSKGAEAAGGHVIGVTAPPLFPGRHGANPYVEELVEATSLSERIGWMMDRASAAIALPGSIGTATELLVAWNTNHIVDRNGGLAVPTVAVGPAWSTVAETLRATIDASEDAIHLEMEVGSAVEWVLQTLEIRQ